MEAALIGRVSSVTPNQVLSGKELSFRLKSLEGGDCLHDGDAPQH